MRTTEMPLLRLERPPVIRARMTFYFDELAEISLSHLAGFLIRVRRSYPEVSERFPLPKTRLADDSASFSSSPSGLPFPLVTLSAPGTGRELSFQADRFTLSWSFGEDMDIKQYPGFDSLKAMFLEAYLQFVDELKILNADISVVGAEVLYRNAVTELPGAGLALYLLTGRDDLTARDVAAGRTYAGARIRFPNEVEDGIQAVSAGVDSPNDEETVLWIKVLSESDGSSETELLDSSHAELIRRFIAFTPDWLRASWGEEKS